MLAYLEENKTGLPDNLKSGIENLSGHSMDDVKVHYNSDKPAQLQAHAYAQGTDIHLGAGQEKHLPHEAWHVVQQKQGRVKPTMQMKGKVNVNDDSGLEREADVMGAKALQRKENNKTHFPVKSSTIQQKKNTIQRVDDTNTTEAKVAKLHIHADIDVNKMSPNSLLKGAVGHAWVSLEWNDPNTISQEFENKYPNHVNNLKSRSNKGNLADPIGFWPFMFESYDAAQGEIDTPKLKEYKLLEEKIKIFRKENKSLIKREGKLDNKIDGTSNIYKRHRFHEERKEIRVKIKPLADMLKRRKKLGREIKTSYGWTGSNQRVFYSSKPFKSYVKGQVVHPDTLHEPKETKSYNITEKEAIKVADYAKSKENAKYSVYFYNCTTFAKEAVEATGKTAPKSTRLGIAYPNRLADSIKKQEKNKI